MQLAIIFLWASIPSFQIGWQGTFESWAQAPSTLTPMAHAIRDAQFGLSGAQAFDGVSGLAIR